MIHDSDGDSDGDSHDDCDSHGDSHGDMAFNLFTMSLLSENARWTGLKTEVYETLVEILGSNQTVKTQTRTAYNLTGGQYNIKDTDIHKFGNSAWDTFIYPGRGT